MDKKDKKRIMVAMSGGVDSSVTALLLLKEGYEVEGGMLRVHDVGMTDEDMLNGKLPQNVRMARGVARKLKINFSIIDTRSAFNDCVVKDFVSSYANCLTPNPCILCNREVKFKHMIMVAEAAGFDKVASGHYAIIEFNEETQRYILRKGKDRSKDQSYMLYRLTQEQLSKLIMPLGTYDKEEIRKIAAEAGLKNAEEPDSQDVCFLPDKNYAEFVKKALIKEAIKEGRLKKHFNKIAEEEEAAEKIIREHMPEIPGLAPGNFVDREGKVYGQHKGLIYYTIGQRKGLGLSLPESMYVCEKRSETNEVVLGFDQDLYTNVVRARDVNYVSVAALKDGQKVSAKIRYSQNETTGTVKVLPENCIEVTFDEPVRAATPGQSMVLYDGDVVLAGGFIY